MTYCDFKPGDEVILYRYLEDGGHPKMPPIGHVGFITIIGKAADGGPEIGLQLHNWGHGKFAMNARCFRKVQRRDLSAWLETAATNTDRWDKSVKTPAHPDPVVRALFARIMAGGDR